MPGMDRRKVSLRSDVLTIMDKNYNVYNLDQLAGELSMNTFNQRSDNNVVVFGGIFSNFHPLSNYYRCPLKFRNSLYKSVV